MTIRQLSAPPPPIDPLAGLDWRNPPQAFLDQLPLGIYACDAAGRILWFNRRAAEIWGRSPRLGDNGERFCGSYKLFFGGRQVGREQTPMAEALRAGIAIDGVEGRVERPDGSQVWATVHIAPVRDDEGQVVGAVNCFHESASGGRPESRDVADERGARRGRTAGGDL